jgi:hypothetical protein
MSVLVHRRSDVFGTLLPTNVSGSPRPLLAPNRPILTCHYVGSGTFTDTGDSPSEIRAIHAYSVSPAKRTPWEYSWVVDSDGEIWTYAGEYVAAHSAGNNTTAIGVLLLAGLNDAPTDAMVLGFRQLRWWLLGKGLLAMDHQVLPHRQMPGANTACPGNATLARWGELAEPWHPVIPPSPIVTESDMLAIYRPTFSSPGYDPAWFCVFASGVVRRATNADVALAGTLNVPTIPLDSLDQYRDLLHISGSAYPQP